MLHRPLCSLMVLSLLLAMTTACSVTEQRLVGAWRVDVDATLDLEPVTLTLSAVERRTRKTLLEKFLGPAIYEFTTDGKTVVSVADRRTEGTYEIRRNEDEYMLLGLTDGDRVREVRVDFSPDGMIIEDNRRRIALIRR